MILVLRKGFSWNGMFLNIVFWCSKVVIGVSWFFINVWGDKENSMYVLFVDVVLDLCL